MFGHSNMPLQIPMAILAACIANDINVILPQSRHAGKIYDFGCFIIL